MHISLRQNVGYYNTKRKIIYLPIYEYLKHTKCTIKAENNGFLLRAFSQRMRKGKYMKHYRDLFKKKNI